MADPIQNPNGKQLNKWRFASLAFELGFIIALPLVAMGLLGKWLDARYGSYPKITLVGILLAIVTTTWWLVRRFKEMMK